MPLDLSLRVVSQVCAALEYAHRKKDERGRPMEIVHRDVSPQNILISFEGEVKLVGLRHRQGRDQGLDHRPRARCAASSST